MSEADGPAVAGSAREFALDAETSVRLWINGAAPVAAIPEVGALELYYLSGEARHGAVRSIALEYARHLGGKYRYGLLGCGFYPAATGALRLAVHLTSGGATYEGGFLSDAPWERVRTGLPVEYGPAVLVGVDRNRDLLRALGPGKLVFDRAAHGEVSSNQIVFTYLAQTLTALLAADDALVTEDGVRAAFPT